MRGIHNEVEHDLIELSRQARHERQSGVEVSYHLRNILPLVTRHGNCAFDRLVKINEELLLTAGVRKLLHGTHDLSHPLNALQRLLDGSGDLIK